jgi:hypothetical protein
MNSKFTKVMSGMASLRTEVACLWDGLDRKGLGKKKGIRDKLIHI